MDIVLPSEFSAKKLGFSTPRVLDNGGKVIYISYGNKPLIFQTPEMSCPFGIGHWNNEGKGNDKYTLDLSFKGKETREHLQKFFDALHDLDKTLVKAGLDNSQTWFKKKYASLDVVEALYTPTIKFAKDKATGDVTDKYPPTFKINIPYRDGHFDCEAYDKARNMVDLSTVETKSATVSAIIRCTGIWIAGGKFGCSFKVLQMRISPPSTIKGYAFKELDDKANDDIDDDDDVSVPMPASTQVMTKEDADQEENGEEEEDVEVASDRRATQTGTTLSQEYIESSDDELEAPKPLPVKKRTVSKAK
jgi:hypothetical protein